MARRAALVITEDFPAPPFPRWTQQLATQVDTAVWAVDCACIIPMRLIKRPFARAYAFRNHTQKEYKQRLAQTWEDDETVGEFFEGDCGFESIDLVFSRKASAASQPICITVTCHPFASPEKPPGMDQGEQLNF